MHIAFFSDQHPATLGGLQASLGLQRKHLERLGHTVTVCAPGARRTPSPQYARAHDVLLRAARAGEHSFTLAGERFDRVIDAAFAARRNRPPVDVVHVQADVWGAWNGYRFARRHGLPVVHTMHTDVEAGLPAILPFPGAMFRLLFAAHQRFLGTGPIRSVAEYARAFAERADLLIAPSTHFAERLRGYGVERRIEVLPTGVDDDLLAAIRRAPAPAPRARPVLLWPGRISPEKRLGELLEALARSGADAELHVYGSGRELPRVRRLTHELGVAPRVRFFGSVPHDVVLRAMRGADAVVQSSVGYETQGLTMYEAVSVGTPVILRDRGLARDLPEPLRHTAADTGVGALAAALAAFVSRTARDPGTAERTATDRFAQSRLTARAEALYRGLLRDRARGGAAREIPALVGGRRAA
ncbi:glycosyltransferase [Leucobacter sp. wl10]|uniref:glycosyltransferase n=1 Tax=Leucobacter sp. wl10 TaxID=2304677 RepID=UPI000E5A93E2|nr:glycosyltransferase [Leucobacter sp. wl10]RGE22761.1 glycosyltransferase [Leucobacter sp. wl10]